jgi:hypothetical protein
MCGRETGQRGRERVDDGSETVARSRCHGSVDELRRRDVAKHGPFDIGGSVVIDKFSFVIGRSEHPSDRIDHASTLDFVDAAAPGIGTE